MTIAQTQLNISQVLALGLDLAETAPRLLDLFCRLNDFQVCAWYQPDDTHTFRLFEVKVSDPAITGDIVENTVPKEFVSALDDHNVQAAESSASNDPNVGSGKLLPALRIPLTGKKGKILGMIECFSFDPKATSPEWLIFVESMGLQIGQYIQNLLDRQREEDTATLFAMFCRQMNEAFWICSPRFDKLFYISPMFGEILGRDLSELYDNPGLYLSYVYPDDRVLLQDAARKVKHFPEGLDVDYRLLRPDNTIRWIAARWTPIFNKEGKVEKICGFARDLTKKKEAEARVSEFYSTVSHELRTPLTAIKGALGLVKGGLAGETTKATHDFVSMACNETDRLIRLVNGFLDLRKIELGKTELHLTSITGAELIGAVVTSLGPIAEASGVNLKAVVNEDAAVKCDKDRIVQVLNNFVSNALKFSERGQTIEIISESQKDKIRFEVRDHGPGISTSNMQKLFVIFQQIDCEVTRRTGGSGLGLAISKSLVEMHGGSIGVESLEGKGSTFWFELPILASVSSSYGSFV